MQKPIFIILLLVAIQVCYFFTSVQAGSSTTDDTKNPVPKGNVANGESPTPATIIATPASTAQREAMFNSQRTLAPPPMKGGMKYENRMPAGPPN